jgi:hypothetical protein
MERAGGREEVIPTRFAQSLIAVAGGGTAPLTSFLMAWVVWLTTFLQADQPPGQFVQPAFEAELPGSPPGSACRFAASSQPAFPRSSLPPIPFLSGLARFHLTLPQAPAAYRRRAERYDGKRDLYFLNAA